jgi:4-hydroxythreonine-4-phosphate dehydrogenase
MEKPILGITMGDAAGVGPEITAKTLAKMDIYDICNPLVIGDKDVMGNANKIARKALKVNAVTKIDECVFRYGVIDVYDLNNVDMKKLEHGKISAMTGKASGEYIEKAIELALQEKIDAIVTNPIHKKSFELGGYGKKYPGHTEMLAKLTNTEKYSMMLAHGNFRVVHVTTHVALREACDMVKKDRILEVIKIAHNACKSLSIENPRIAVAALNPHASDGGLFGDEEEKEIAPAIREAEKMGINAEGPIPADAVYSKAKGGQFDIAVAMYHDQGHIPIKLSGFVWNEKAKSWNSISGVNVTLGLPIIRTSVDHGTAFGKAGKGTANPQSLIDAINYAVTLAKNRKKGVIL